VIRGERDDVRRYGVMDSGKRIEWCKDFKEAAAKLDAARSKKAKFASSRTVAAAKAGEEVQDSKEQRSG